MQNIRAIAEADLQHILEAPGGAGNPYTLIAPGGNEYQVSGMYQDVGYLLDEENGVPIQGRFITANYRMSTLKKQTEDSPEKGWRVRIADLNGREHLFGIIRYEPDRTLGIARVTLEVELE